MSYHIAHFIHIALIIWEDAQCNSAATMSSIPLCGASNSIMMPTGTLCCTAIVLIQNRPEQNVSI